MTMVLYSIGVDRPITPGEKLPPLPTIPRRALVVIGGRAPIWRYGQAFHLLHGTAAGAIAVYDPRYGAVVVASHIPDYEEGEVIEMEWRPEGETPAPKEPPQKDESSPALGSSPEPQDATATEKKTRPSNPTVVKESASQKNRRFGSILKKWLAPIEGFSYRLIFQFAEGAEFEIPRIRGIWGKALRSLNLELYRKVFEGVPSETLFKKIPRYLIRPSQTRIDPAEFGSPEQGFLEEVEFLTWGVSDQERDDLIEAWCVAGTMGIGAKRLPFSLIAVLPGIDTKKGILSMRSVLRGSTSRSSIPTRLIFPVPLRLIASENRQDRPIYEPQFSEIVKSALFRLAAIRSQLVPELNQEPDTSPNRPPEFADELLQFAQTIPASNWIGEKLSLLRYSGRQRAEIKLSGTVGYLDLPNGAGALTPLLMAAEYFHVGKSTTLGLGRMKMEALS